MSPFAQTASLTPVSILERFEALERDMLRHFVDATSPAARKALGLSVHEAPGAAIIACEATGNLFVNRAVGFAHARVEPQLADRSLAILGAPRRSPNFLIQLTPSVGRAAWERCFEQRGLVAFRRDWVVLSRGVDDVPHASTRFRLVPAARRDAPSFAEIITESLGIPSILRPMFEGLVERRDWYVYLALDGTRPVAAGALFVHGRACYLAGAATIPSHRGAGAHDALIARRIELARSLGCDIVFVETGCPVSYEPSPSLDNLHTNGFVDAFIRRNLAPPGATWTGDR